MERKAKLPEKPGEPRQAGQHAPPFLYCPHVAGYSLIRSWDVVIFVSLWGSFISFQTGLAAAHVLLGLHFHLLGNTETEELKACCWWTLK